MKCVPQSILARFSENCTLVNSLDFDQKFDNAIVYDSSLLLDRVKIWLADNSEWRIVRYYKEYCNGLLILTSSERQASVRNGGGNTGTIIAKLLSECGFPKTASCSCGNVEAEMNACGPEGCLKRIDYFTLRIRESFAEWMAETTWKDIPTIIAGMACLASKIGVANFTSQNNAIDAVIRYAINNSESSLLQPSVFG